MQLRRSVLLALMIVLFVYFEIHSCSEDHSMGPSPPGPENADLVCKARKVFFLDRETGWVLGMYGTMMKTTDGGETWRGSTIADVGLNGIYFIDHDKGWVVGREGKIFRTADGGETWERAIFSGTPQNTDLYEVRFLNETLGFILGYCGLYRTIDGGMLWENYWLPVIPRKGAWNMSIVDDCLGYLLGSSWMEPDPPLVYRTQDGALSWSAVEGSESSVLRAVMTIEFIDELRGWAGGGVIMRTDDGGKTWTTQRDDATVREFFFCGPSTGYAVGGVTLLRTTDGGDSWLDVTPSDGRIVDLRSVYFVDADCGWIVGQASDRTAGGRTYAVSLLFRTVDGGDTWEAAGFEFDYTDYLGASAPEADP
jgi:photosystem II stability/assembly factor-like uncharacterized protein